MDNIKKELHNLLDQTVERKITKNLRHYYLLLRWKDITSKKDLYNALQTLRKNNIIYRVEQPTGKTKYIPTPEGRRTTTALINQSQKQRVHLYRCLHRYTYRDVDSEIKKMLDIADDFRNNYNINIFPALRNYADKLPFINLTNEQVLEDLEEQYRRNM